MWFLAVGPDIHEKIEALNGGNESGATFFAIIAWCVVAVLILTIAYLATRNLFRNKQAPATRGERRGMRPRRMARDDSSSDPAGIDNGDLAEDLSLDDKTLALHELEPGTRVSLFWDVGEMRCGCLGRVVAPRDMNIEIRFDSDAAPHKGRALLVCPEVEGHVSFYEIRVEDALEGTSRVLASATTRTASRMNRRYRTHVAVQAALTTRDRAQNETEPVVVRLHNMAFDGLGVLSEGRIKPEEKFILRVQLPGYLDPLTLEGDVAWSEKDIAGIWRAGLNLDFEDIETCLNLADYMFGRLKAESSALILERRRGEHTSGKIPQVSLS